MEMEKIVDTSRGKFTIRPYASEDKMKVQELWEICFDDKIDKNLWDWKYVNSPYGSKVLLCCSENQTIAVMYGGIPYLANWKGQVIKIAHLVDIMAHPRYRGWLFVKTAKAFFDTCTGFPEPAFLYGLPGEKHFVIGQKLLKYRKLVGGMVYLTCSTSELAKIKPKFWNKIFPIHSADNRFDKLWLRVKKSYPFSAIRESRFIDWRFYKHPKNTYEVWGYGSFFSSELKAYVVLLSDYVNGVAHLIDILIYDSRNMIKDLLHHIGYNLNKKGITEIRTWLPAHHFIAESAKSAGFNAMQEPLGIIPVGRSFDLNLELDWVSKNIFYTMADGDLF